eukprot:CAMPEP_0116904008 /NCGR_PEP_ID=MMETSP0467-20121206/11122_1 /TAXON_ID=283647 /ORGANISM="Mesodinium pulex, Strain SPMC105" /LENGTH=127 /DNA_ID=CAMNT_0004578489 /DNA_START=1094 /DNA_END=1477 /DNA_ORIENTATION=+
MSQSPNFNIKNKNDKNNKNNNMNTMTLMNGNMVQSVQESDFDRSNERDIDSDLDQFNQSEMSSPTFQQLEMINELDELNNSMGKAHGTKNGIFNIVNGGKEKERETRNKYHRGRDSGELQVTQTSIN